MILHRLTIYLSISIPSQQKDAASRIVIIIHIPLVFAMGGGGWIIRRLSFEYVRYNDTRRG